MKTLRKTLDEDRTKTFTAEISKLGLVEMTRQNVTEGVREIMSRPCPTCEGEGVIRSEETIAIEFERKLRDVAVEHPEAEAFLVQVNPRVSTQFTGHNSRVLHALEAQTGKSFLFEGSEGLTLDHFAITFIGTREEVEERALPVRPGGEGLVEVVEAPQYDAVAKIDGYIISIAGAAPCVGEKRMVRIDEVGRTAATALLLDESGEVVSAPARIAPARSAGGGRGRRRSSGSTDADAATETPAPPSRRRRPPVDGEDAEARREAGLSESPTSIDSEPEQEPAGVAPAEGATAEGEGGEDGLQSKPRRRGRRGGRRRSAAKAKATPEESGGSRPGPGRRFPPVRESRTSQDMYAIVKTGGKQYRVERGQKLLVERLAVAEGDDVALEPI